MIRYRSVRIAPGANPRDGMESEENSRPTGDVAPDGGTVGGNTVGIWDSKLIAWPHDAQNRLSAETAAEHDVH